jgi:hypothetical protein
MNAAFTLRQVFVGGGDDPHVDGLGPSAAEAADDPVLGDLEQLRLQAGESIPISSRKSIPRCASSASASTGGDLIRLSAPARGEVPPEATEFRAVLFSLPIQKLKADPSATP